MKFVLAALLATVATAEMKVNKRMSNKRNLSKTTKVEMKDISADSKLGQTLMSKARKLEEDDADVDFTWVANYSLKFQGCHHISQWNEEADGEDEVRIQTKRLVRFRLCPSDYCNASNAAGCSSGYGDYVVDLNTYLAAYMESVEAYWESKCEALEEGDCACENANDDEKCQYDCFVTNGVEEYCADGNPYNDDEAADVQFELEEYMECGRFELEEDDDGNRKLEEEEVEYYLGPYCADQGGAIYLGMFTDETCTTFADEYGGHKSFESMTGEELPYGKSNIVDMDCISCMEPQDADENNDGNDNQDGDEVREICENLYMSAGKCEKNMNIDNKNENACNYMEGIKIIRKNGTVDPSAGSANKTASIFIGFFSVSFVLLGAYVYYLKTKLDRASINLAE